MTLRSWRSEATQATAPAPQLTHVAEVTAIQGADA
jgi:hypothetical protein